MKKYNIAALLVLAVVLLTGCKKETGYLGDYVYELSAMIESNSNTRTSLSGLQSGAYSIQWTEGDEIAVFSENVERSSRFVLKEGAGTNSATFLGNREQRSPVAIYPFDESAVIEDNVISFTLPAKQVMVKGSFAQGCFPMVAKWNDGALEFKNLCAIMKISISGEAAIRSIKLTAKDSTTFLSGPATISTTYESVPELVMCDGGSNHLIMDCKGVELSEDSETDFMFAIPAQTYNGGFELTIDAYTEVIKKNIDGDLTFNRSRMRHLKGMVVQAQKPQINYDAIPYDEIWYKTTDNRPYVFANYVTAPFDRNVISNTYENGLGIIKCDGPITIIKKYAFDAGQNECNLLELYLPDKITTMENNAIYNQSKLRVLKISKDLEITDGQFIGLGTALARFIGDNVSEDGRCIIVNKVLQIFADYDIDEYNIPDGVESIGNNAFCWSHIREISFPEGLKTICAGAFYNCSFLKKVVLPSSLEYLSKSAFSGCKNIRGFYGNEKFHTEDNMCLLYREDDKLLLTNFAGMDLQEYRIPDGIYGIYGSAFINKPLLNKIYFPESLKEISYEAFDNTRNISVIDGPNVLDDKRSLVVDGKLLFVASAGLKEYTTPETVRYISIPAFRYSKDLEEVVFSDNIRGVDESFSGFFEGCSNLRTITISANMEELGRYIFQPSKTPKLETVYCRAVLPPKIDSGSNELKFDNLTIYIPKGTMGAYTASSEWKPYYKYLKEYEYSDLPQDDCDYYVSKDYSQNGKTVQLQKASEGQGINIVLMGDGYSDRQIADGLYQSDMELAYNSLFTVEPYSSYKNLFNVSYVNVVSATEGFDYGNTALDCGFGKGTLVYGDNDECISYAKRAVSSAQMDETLIIVIMNSPLHYGTCYWYTPSNASSSSDYGSGTAIAYFPKGGSSERLAQVLHHEANGHGFTKLADEYAHDFNGHISSVETDINKYKQDHYGWYKNVDFTDDPAQVRWKKFLEDSRYANEGLGVFEGGLTYWRGVWKPTVNSIMKDNKGSFNAPSREAIYYRIHKLAYGAEWKYDYEKFVEYDAINRNKPSTRASGVSPLRPQEQLHPPVIVGRHWSEEQ